MAKIPETLRQGLTHHQAGDLDQAEQTYQRILRVDPRHADALHLLGVIGQQRGQPARAVELIGKAIAVDSSNPHYHTNLGAAHQALGQARDAEACYRRAIHLQPRHADAHFNLGVLLEALGRSNDAIHAYEQATRYRPELAQAHLNLGNVHKALGRTAEAEAAFRRAIHANPNYSLAWYNLGNLLQSQARHNDSIEAYTQAATLEPGFKDAHYNLGTAYLAARLPDRAAASLRKAVALAADDANTWNNLGLALRTLEQFDEARECFTQALALRPAWAEAHNNLGSVHTSLGDRDQAIECYRRAIALDSHLATAHRNLGLAQLAAGDASAARAALEAALALSPHDADCLVDLGAACERQGDLPRATMFLEQAVALAPDHAGAHYNLGNVLASRNELEASIISFRKSIALRPDFAAAHNNLGQVQQSLGAIDEAETCYRQALALSPLYATAWNNLGVVCHSRARMSEAIGHFRRALELDPQHEQANVNLGSLLKNQGRLAEARACFDAVLARFPDRNRVRLLSATMLPPVYQSLEELRACRAQYAAQVAGLIAQGAFLDPERDEMPSIFFLPYQGENDVVLQRDVARLYPVTITPPRQVLRRRTPGERIRIGFVSHHFRNHTIAHLMQGIIARISRERFEVTVISVGDHRDAMAESIRRHADQFVVIPENSLVARQVIAAQALDILFYCDLGMDPVTYTLAFHRLAPVQCVTWGHPVTTGIPNVDYFISSELLEPPGGESHYTERLVRLKGLPTYYQRPAAAAGDNCRARFALPEDCHLYLCPQSLFKIHPDFDPLVQQILERDPAAVVAFIEGLEPEWTETLHARLRARMGPLASRVQFLPKQGREDFLAVLAGCDVMLDPLHFGGGNTTYEALAQGTPIVTLPSASMRGRVSAACYHKMGLHDCVAASPEEYVELALRLGNDPAYRRTMQSRILASCSVLYEDAATLRELEHFLEHALAAVETGREIMPLSAAAPSVAASRTLHPTQPGRDERALTNARSATPRVWSPQVQQASAAPVSVTREIVLSGQNTSEQALPTEASTSPPIVTPPRNVARIPALLPEILRTCTCPACGHHVAVPFYDGGRQPLATVAWPRSPAEAQAMKRLPLTFLRCVDCGHVYNRDFDYAEVPYSEKPNLMFNRGGIWADHLRQVRDLLLATLPERPVVVEVGCGEGHLLRGLAESRSEGRYVGFDPSNAINTGNGLIEGRRELFEPSRHLAELRPDLIVSRHVLEHLMNPLGFVQAISFAASWEDIETRLFIEVPCIDRVIQIGRTVDFFYEHNSNFTTASLGRLLDRCASEVELVQQGYQGEVVYGLARFTRRNDQVQFAREAVAFRERVERQRESIRADLDRLASSGLRIAIWGGTGKAAAFINQHQLDAARFPLVVDSDPDKAGTFVPGTGQEIRHRDCLRTEAADVILVATQWRAADIVLEIEQAGLAGPSVLVEHDGRLLDYHAGDHPYRRRNAA